MRLARQGVRMRRTSAGFTLVELMTVVAITGILATIGVVLVRGHVNAAKTNRALAGIQAIRVAEAQYRAQGGQYLSCSSFSEPKWFPMEVPGKFVQDWRNFSRPDDGPCWKQLGVLHSGGTQYGYTVHAGLPSGTYPTLKTANDPVLPTPAPQLWYVIQVKGDVDGDETPMHGVATSYNGEVYLENETE